MRSQKVFVLRNFETVASVESTLCCAPHSGVRANLTPRKLGRSFRVSLRGLLAVVGLAIGFALPKPFVLRILKTCAARTLLLAMVTFGTLLFSGCASGDFIYTSGQQQNTFGVSGVPQNSAFVDWTKPARDQTGLTYPQYNGIGFP
jgi:hypothetical protein